jgi:tRNA (guanosine-2'-O-)-methyltransferase
MTPSRFRKIKQVLARRQPDLTVVMDKVHKPHNLAAIARSCDAVGVLSLHAVTDQTEIHLRQKAAMGAGHWLTVIRHERVENALEALKASGHQIVAAVAGEDAKDYRDID